MARGVFADAAVGQVGVLVRGYTVARRSGCAARCPAKVVIAVGTFGAGSPSSGSVEIANSAGGTDGIAAIRAGAYGTGNP